MVHALTITLIVVGSLLLLLYIMYCLKQGRVEIPGKGLAQGFANAEMKEIQEAIKKGNEFRRGLREQQQAVIEKEEFMRMRAEGLNRP